MKTKYIDKTFPITLQDLIDLAKSENKDPKDLKLILNSNQADLSAYVQCALLNPDQGNISIELYTEASDGLHEDISLKTKQKSKPCSNSPHEQNQLDKALHILNGIDDLVNDLINDQNCKVDIKQVTDTDIKYLNDALSILQAFTLNQNK